MALRSTIALLASCTAMLVAGTANAETVTVYAAGSLRGVIAALAPKASAMGIEIVPTFGGSGELRDRIERGATPDLLLSADMASPRRLAAEGKAMAPAIAFAGNRLCLVARRSLGLTPDNFAARLAGGGIRIRTSKPIADPSGDYAMAMFDRIDTVHPGAGKRLSADAQANMSLTATAGAAGQNPTAALFAAGMIDVAVTYCSASGELAKSGTGLVSIPVPAAFDPRPLFGMALLSGHAATMHLALLLLSDVGQAAIASSGLIPLTIDPQR